MQSCTMLAMSRWLHQTEKSRGVDGLSSCVTMPMRRQSMDRSLLVTNWRASASPHILLVAVESVGVHGRFVGDHRPALGRVLVAALHQRLVRLLLFPAGDRGPAAGEDNAPHAGPAARPRTRCTRLRRWRESPQATVRSSRRPRPDGRPCPRPQTQARWRPGRRCRPAPSPRRSTVAPVQRAQAYLALRACRRTTPPISPLMPVTSTV